MGGRFFMGMGVSIIASAGPCYVVEISPPAYRGIVTGFYKVFWPVGTLVTNSACRGALSLPGHASWLVPIWLQAMLPGVVLIIARFLPESPPLHTYGKPEQANTFLTEWHENSNLENEWVKLRMREYNAHLEMDSADKRCSFPMSWTPVKDPKKQNNLFVVMNPTQCIVSFAGSMLVDKIGRRPLLVWSTSGKESSAATVAMIYIFQAVYFFGWAPMQALYPVGVLFFEMRAKGIVFSNMFVIASTHVNQFGFPWLWPTSSGRHTLCSPSGITVWCVIQVALIYFCILGTKNRTLEELDKIFSFKNPIKAPIAKKKLELDENANVVGIFDMCKDGSNA
ncbi:lactose permease [Diplocarpon rosae]|nr:lactose permease [Diplocarpon rosae]